MVNCPAIAGRSLLYRAGDGIGNRDIVLDQRQEWSEDVAGGPLRQTGRRCATLTPQRSAHFTLPQKHLQLREDEFREVPA